MGHVIVFGSTSGIAEKVVLALIEQRYEPILCARDPGALARQAADLKVRFGKDVPTHVWDASDPAGQAAAFDRCAEGREILGVVYAAGVMYGQEESESDWAMTSRTFALNLAAPAVLLNHVAQRFAARGKGFISCLSSVAGDRGRPSNFIYGASKAGLSAYLEGLRAKYARKGVLVQTVKPGMVSTKMTAALKKSPLMADPMVVAKDIVAAIGKGREVLYTPFYWRYVMAIIRAIPAFLFKKLSL